MYLEARREDAGDIRPVDNFTHYHLFALTTGYQQQQLVDCWLVAEILKSTDNARSKVTLRNGNKSSSRFFMPAELA